jgi:hypothetical protein
MGQAFRALFGNQGLQPETDEGSFFRYTGELSCPFDKIIIDIQCRSHTYKYAFKIHICQEKSEFLLGKNPEKMASRGEKSLSKGGFLLFF